MKLHATLINVDSQKTRSSNDFIRIQVKNEERELIMDYLVKADGTITGWHAKPIQMVGSENEINAMATCCYCEDSGLSIPHYSDDH